MIQFKEGDRVRYTGKHFDTNDPTIVGELGTVRVQTGPSNVNVIMDKAEINGKQTGQRGFFPENIELIPREIKVGDRVTYTGTLPSGKPYAPGSSGSVVALVDHQGVPSATVVWDAGIYAPSPSFLTNLEILPMPKSLDLTQPLVLLTRGGDPKPVKFLAKTEAGDIMVDTHGIGKDSHWMQFTTDGTFLRAALAGGSASALKLVNEEPKVVHRFDITVVDGQPFFGPRGGGTGGHVQVTTQGDKIVSIATMS